MNARGSRKLTSLALPALIATSAFAQSPGSPADAYARAIHLGNLSSAYVGELLVRCVEAGAWSEEHAEARTKAYLARNAVTMRRIDEWSKAAEKRLDAAGQGRSVRERAQEAGMQAVLEASQRAKRELRTARDAQADCRSTQSRIDAGDYDLDRDRELTALLAKRE